MLSSNIRLALREIPFKTSDYGVLQHRSLRHAPGPRAHLACRQLSSRAARCVLVPKALSALPWPESDLREKGIIFRD